MVGIIPSSLLTPQIAQPRPTALRSTIFGQAPKFDFDKGEFVFTGTGDLALGNEIETLTQRIRLALTTVQFIWKIYDTPTLGFFGSQLPTLIGKRYDEGVKLVLAKKWATDALLGDSRIRNISVQTLIEGDQLYILISLTLATGKTLDLQQNWTIK